MLAKQASRGGTIWCSKIYSQEVARGYVSADNWTVAAPGSGYWTTLDAAHLEVPCAGKICSLNSTDAVIRMDTIVEEDP